MASQTDATDRTVNTLAEFASTLDYGDLTRDAIHAAKRSLIDSLGCAIGSFHAKPVVSLRRLASRVQSEKPATLIGTRKKTSPDLAALVNGTMTRYSDFSDDYFGNATSPARGDVGPHPSDNIGAILAAAESAGVDGKTFILGLILGYEICGQFAENVVLRANGWDYTPFHSAASALAAGRLLGLDKEQLAHALRLAIVPNIALFETRMGELSQWKGIAGPNATRNGLFAAQMAAEGITGPAKAFEGPNGFIRQLNAPFKMDAMGGKGRPFRIEMTYFKSLPVCYEFQTAIELALQLHGSISPADIRSMKVTAGKGMYTREQDPTRWAPKTRETADQSAPYLIAAALADGEISHDTFTEKRFRDPMLLSIADKIEVVMDSELRSLFPWKMQCRFEIISTDGQRHTFESENPKGHPQKPMSDHEIYEKFHKQTAPLLSAAESQRIVECVLSLETAGNVAQLMELMAIERQLPA